MKLLLTSAGIKNKSIQEALVGLLGKPIAESSALCIPTALYGHPMAGPGNAWRFIFSIFPHLDNPDLPQNTLATAETWAAGLGNPAYAIDDETAFRVVDGTVDVVSEGHWKLFPS